MNASPLLAHLRQSVAAFAEDQEGSATVWNLTWLVGFAIMGGVAIDSTNAWRHKTMLASTADVAAVAGAIEIPNPERNIPVDEDAVKQVGYNFALKNLGKEQHGEYINRDVDVILGHWDRDTRTFTPRDEFDPLDPPLANAVKAWNARNRERQNTVQTSLLRFVRVWDWEIETVAVAMRGLDQCYTQGVMSRDEVCITSNNDFYPGTCIHGEGGVNLRNNNTWAQNANGEGLVSVSSNGTDNIADSNYDNGLAPVAKGYKYVPMVNSIPEIANDILAGPSHMTVPQWIDNGPVVELVVDTIESNDHLAGAWLDTPAEVQLASMDGFASVASLLAASHHSPGHSGGGGSGSEPGAGGGGGGGSSGCDGGRSGGSLVDPLGNRLIEPATFDSGYIASSGVLERNRVYFHTTGNDLTIDGTLHDVTIVTKGSIDIKKDSVLENVTLVSLDDRPTGNDAVKIGTAQLGRRDDCAAGGGVKIFAMGSIGGPSKAEWNGVVLVSGGTIGFAAQSDSAHGLSMYAAGNIKFTANDIFGSEDGSGLNAEGGCSEGVPVGLWDDAYRVSLVQ